MEVIKKYSMAVVLLSMLISFCYISFSYNVMGGQAFASDPEKEELWRKAFFCITAMSAICMFVAYATTSARRKLTLFTTLLCTVSAGAGSMGWIADLSKKENIVKADIYLTTLKTEAASSIVGGSKGIFAGLSDAGEEKNTRVAAQGKFFQTTAIVKDAVSNAEAAAQKMKNTDTFTTQISHNLKITFSIILAALVEISIAVLGGFLGALFCRPKPEGNQRVEGRTVDRNVGDELSTQKCHEIMCKNLLKNIYKRGPRVLITREEKERVHGFGGNWEKARGLINDRAKFNKGKAA